MIDNIVLSNLIYNEVFGRKVIAFLKPEYFDDRIDRVVFELIESYVQKYNSFPSKEALAIDLSNKKDIDQEIAKKGYDLIETLQADPSTDLSWLVDQTEQFCKDKALYNAMSESIALINDKGGNHLDRGSIVTKIQDALGVQFNTRIGTDFIEDADELYDFMHRKEVLIPFDLDFFNRVTGGGLSRKTLNIILAGTNVGKSLFMCHMAAAALAAGFNVLYITLEMAEQKIAKRIAANLYDVTMDDLDKLTKIEFDRKVEKLKSKTQGKLIIHEYPTSCAGVAHFRYLVNELRLKKKFKPQIMFIDYLNISKSTRLKHGANVNSYTYIKTIAEEFRGLAVELDLPLVSATQTTRSGHSNTDLELEDTSESFGLPGTADFMFGLSTSEELEKLNQLLVKILKARDHSKKLIKRFVIGVDQSKMRCYDVEQSAQKITDGPVMDRTDFGQKDHERVSKKFDKSKLKGVT